MKEFIKDYNPACWGCKGPELLTKVIKDYCKTNDFYNTIRLTKDRIYNTILDIAINNQSKCDLHVYPINNFYPINWMNAQNLFTKSGFDKELFLDTYIIHFWNKMSKKYHAKPGDGSVYEYFSKLNCPYIYKMNDTIVF